MYHHFNSIYLLKVLLHIGIAVCLEWMFHVVNVLEVKKALFRSEETDYFPNLLKSWAHKKIWAKSYHR